MKIKTILIGVLLVVVSFASGFLVNGKNKNEFANLKVSEEKNKTGYKVNLSEENYKVELRNNDKEIVFLYAPTDKKLDAKQITIPVTKGDKK